LILYKNLVNDAPESNNEPAQVIGENTVI